MIPSSTQTQTKHQGGDGNLVMTIDIPRQQPIGNRTVTENVIGENIRRTVIAI